MNKLFVFDLDDTLMLNAHHYSVAFMDFYNFLMKVWNHKITYIGTVSQIQEDIDLGLGNEINPVTGEEFAFSMERFPTSLVYTYQQLCEDLNHEFVQEIADTVYSIGMTAFDAERYTGFMPHAKSVLKFLAKNGDTAVLLTKGDERVQEPKINALGLDQWFFEMHVVPRKSVSVFHEIANRHSYSNSMFSVGNSFYSDIKPALEAGFTGIYVPCPTWKAEVVPEDYDRDNVFTIASIKELIDLYCSGSLDAEEAQNA